VTDQQADLPDNEHIYEPGKNLYKVGFISKNNGESYTLAVYAFSCEDAEQQVRQMEFVDEVLGAIEQ
jgi:hypothetical protein